MNWIEWKLIWDVLNWVKIWFPKFMVYFKFDAISVLRQSSKVVIFNPKLPLSRYFVLFAKLHNLNRQMLNVISEQVGLDPMSYFQSHGSKPSGSFFLFNFNQFSKLYFIFKILHILMFSSKFTPTFHPSIKFLNFRSFLLDWLKFKLIQVDLLRYHIIALLPLSWQKWNMRKVI